MSRVGDDALAIGGGGGAFAVQKLEPGPGTGVDSLEVMLDSLATGRIAKPVAAAPSGEAGFTASSTPTGRRWSGWKASSTGGCSARKPRW